MKFTACVFLFLLLWQPFLFAQHQPVFPTLSGQELLDNLVTSYKPLVLLNQAVSRDSLFGKVDNHDDSLTCVYTGLTIYLNPALDPTQAAFAFDINTEHTFPQSLGAYGQAEGDMHHLYPTLANVNAARGNSPFADIPDNQTQEWYYQNQKLTSIPTSNIDLYSERKDLFFEPREDHKGNVARSMFYFYTMYKGQADNESPNFFAMQKQTLCAWHTQDPVDGTEWERTFKIAHFQDGKPNPFVLDCTLAERTYCSDFGTVCVPVLPTEEADNQGFVLEQNSPNPFSNETLFSWNLTAPGLVTLEIYNLLGEKIEIPVQEWQTAGPHHFLWNKKANLPAGVAFYRLLVTTKNKAESASGKMLILGR